MSSDGGELGRGLIRNAESLQSSIDHALDRQRMAGLADPLEGMPEEVIGTLRAIETSVWRLLRAHDRTS